MLESKNEDWLRRFTQEDGLAVGMRIALSGLGPFGVLIGEFVTQFVPQQRVDRIHDFVEQLHDRLGALEEEFKARLHASGAFAALTEEATLHAVRTPSDCRRRDLAELLRTGLTRSDAELVDHLALLHVLESLNDVQVLILIQYGSFSQAMGDNDRAAFIAKNAEVLSVRPPGFGDGENERRRWAMYAHYVDELIARALLRDTEGVAKSSVAKRVQITPLGRLLLTAIGQPVQGA